MQGWGVSRVTEVSHWGAAEHCRKGARVLDGSLFLTACFFVCFIQLLERVQQFLWGENVRGSWEGREDSELTYLLQPEASVPDSPSPQPWSGSSGSWKGYGDGTLGTRQIG